LADAVEGDGAEVARRDDAVGVDVVAAQRNGAAGDGGDDGVGRFLLGGHQIFPSLRTSVMRPLRAAATAMTGLTSSVRPEGEPWRPLKLRLLVDALISRFLSLSGFMARHMEQPGSRHWKPASVKILSSPKASASFCTGSEPGTTMARTLAGTLPPNAFTALAASWRSERRPL